MFDFKPAVRTLLKNPGFTLAAALTLAIGIGANAALFATFGTLVLHPVRYPQPDRLVRLWSSNPALNLNSSEISWTRYESIRDHQRSFAAVAASAFTGYTVTWAGNEPEQLNTLAVTANFLPTMGVVPWRGRNFTAEEDSPGGPKVAILSYEYWQRAFGGREAAVGETLRLNGDSYVVVGITPRSLGNPFGTVLLFVPRASEVVSREQKLNGSMYLQATARLNDGVTLGQATSEISVLSRDYQSAFPEKLDAKNETLVKPFADELVGSLRPTFYLLLGAVGLVHLIACANVAALFLGRLSARHREIVLRVSLGATRAHLARQFFVESALFSLLAGALGVLFGWMALAGIQQLAASQIPPGVVLRMDRAALAFTAGTAMLSALFVGLVPTLQASRRDLNEILKDASRGSSGGVATARFRSVLMTGEVMLSVVLLVLSGLLLASFARLQRAAPGFAPGGVATALVSLPNTRYGSGAQKVQFYDQLVARLEAQPQVQRAALAFGAPMTGFQPRGAYAVAGQPIRALAERPTASFDLVTEHYFETMKIPLIAGRGFDGRDDDKVPIRCVISESLAKRLFPAGSALGKILLRGPRADVKCEIVGVAGDVKSAGLTSAAPDGVYFSVRQFPWRLMVLLVRTGGDPTTLQPLIRSTVAGIDPNQPIAEFNSLEALVSDSFGAQRITAWLTGIFAGVALLLAAIGLYSVLAFIVTQRTAEIGIRMALGARRSQVVALVLQSGLRLVGFGLALGLAAAAAASRLIQTLLFGVQPFDPLIYGGVTALFAVITVAACLLPSLRASRIDPIVALRAE